MIHNDFKGKNIGVLGYGVEGKATVDFLMENKAKVHIFDELKTGELDEESVKKHEHQGVSFTLGQLPALTSLDLIIRSPGIRPDRHEIQAARRNGVPVTTATNIFFDRCPEIIVGITGTKGKGTTAALLHDMLKRSGKKSHLGGNIGTPMLSLLHDITPDSIVVLELSSFQLMDATHSPHIAIVLMVTKEHFDYHVDEQEYVNAKTNIVRFQKPGDFLIVNCDYKNSSDIASASKATTLYVSSRPISKDGCAIEHDHIVVRFHDKRTDILPIHDVFLPGKHNLENVCAATMAAAILNVNTRDIAQSLKEFRGLEHRLEFIRELRDIRYYNDSFATTPESTIAAIRSFDNSLILILGGSSKGSDFTELGKAIETTPNIKAIIGVGKEWRKIKSCVHETNAALVEGLTTMREIVAAARQHASPGDIVMLSPACASFDLFKNYKDRGDQFRAAVHALT